MSGMEIVGVVLGVLPLLLEGLKAYRHGLQTASHMIRYEGAVSDLLQRFSAYNILYRNTCERLVRPLMLDDDKWSKMIETPGGAVWQTDELTIQIQQILGKDYSTYIAVTQLLNAKLKKFALKLDLDPTNNLQPKWMTASPTIIQTSLRQKFFKKSNQTWKGLKIGLENGNLEEALQRIEADISLLEKLLDGIEREAPARRDRGRRSNIKVWQNVRSAAENIFEALTNHWQCDPSHNHVASLRLETRQVTTNEDELRFGLVLSLNHDEGHRQTLRWHELEFEPKEGVPASNMTDEIQDLCDWQHGSQQHQKQARPGYLRHQLWQHSVLQKTGALSKSPTLRTFSLRDCIGGGVHSNPACSVFVKGFSTREKYHIATVLASSMLQLAQTSWLPASGWSLEDLFLMDCRQRSLTAAYPYFCQTFPPTSLAHKTSQANPVIENELVFALGVILIELAYQQPLASFKLATDQDAQGNDHQYTNLQIANRLVKDLYSMEGEKYADAARKCVKCHFDVRDFSFDNPGFQEQFYTNVFLPLEELKGVLG